MRLSLLCLFVVGLVHSGVAFNILGVFPTMSKSHYITGGALLRGLAAAGHNVTAISAFPQKKAIPNYRDYPITGIVEKIKGKLC